MFDTFTFYCMFILNVIDRKRAHNELLVVCWYLIKMGPQINLQCFFTITFITSSSFPLVHSKCSICKCQPSLGQRSFAQSSLDSLILFLLCWDEGTWNIYPACTLDTWQCQLHSALPISKGIRRKTDGHNRSSGPSVLDLCILSKDLLFSFHLFPSEKSYSWQFLWRSCKNYCRSVVAAHWS